MFRKALAINIAGSFLHKYTVQYCNKPSSLCSMGIQSSISLLISPSPGSSAWQANVHFLWRIREPILILTDYPTSLFPLQQRGPGTQHRKCNTHSVLHPNESFPSTSHTEILTIATTGPECMYFTRPVKKGRSFRSM